MKIKIYLAASGSGMLAGMGITVNEPIAMKLAWEGDSIADLDIESGISDEAALEDVFRIFNIEHPLQYRNRSLSVGDIVSIENRNFTCESVGWKYVGSEPLSDTFTRQETVIV